MMLDYYFLRTKHRLNNLHDEMVENQWICRIDASGSGNERYVASLDSDQENMTTEGTRAERFEVLKVRWGVHEPTITESNP